MFRSKNIKHLPSAMLSIEMKLPYGTLKLQDILISLNADYYCIPAKWPRPKVQQGYCCGLYALENALNVGFQQSPPARKEGNKNITSLREVAKKNGWTNFGEITSVNVLDHLARFFNFNQCEVSENHFIKSDQYIKKMCDKIEEGYTLIVASDMDKTYSFPKNSKGLYTHWALIFGYFFGNNKCHFLVAQDGNYYIWDANQLYSANKQLPNINPRAAPKFLYFKDQYKEEHFVPNKVASKKYPTLSIPDNSLEKFKFSFFCVPGSNMVTNTPTKKCLK